MSDFIISKYLKYNLISKEEEFIFKGQTRVTKNIIPLRVINNEYVTIRQLKMTPSLGFIYVSYNTEYFDFQEFQDLNPLFTFNEVSNTQIKQLDKVVNNINSEDKTESIEKKVLTADEIHTLISNKANQLRGVNKDGELIITAEMLQVQNKIPTIDSKVNIAQRFQDLCNYKRSLIQFYRRQND